VCTTIKTEKAVFITAFSVLKNEVSGLEHAREHARIKTTSKCCFYLEQRSFVNKQASVSEAWRIYKTSDRSEVSKRKKSRAYGARRALNLARFLRFKRTILTGLRK
jgi:PleD family two-component response regulator